MSINLKKFKYISWEVSHLGWRRDVLLPKYRKRVKVWNKRSYGNAYFNLKYYLIHKGNMWIRVKNSKFKNKFKLGSFAVTRKPFYFPIFKKKKKK